MTAKEQALYAIMEGKGYSYGCLMTSIQILCQSQIAQDEIINYLYDQNPTEQEFIEHLAEICNYDKIR